MTTVVKICVALTWITLNIFLVGAYPVGSLTWWLGMANVVVGSMYVGVRMMPRG